MSKTENFSLIRTKKLKPWSRKVPIENSKETKQALVPTITKRLNIFTTKEDESLAFSMLLLVKQQTLSKTIRHNCQTVSFFPKKKVLEKFLCLFFCECKKRKEAIERGKRLLASAFFLTLPFRLKKEKFTQQSENNRFMLHNGLFRGENKEKSRAK